MDRKYAHTPRTGVSDSGDHMTAQLRHDYPAQSCDQHFDRGKDKLHYVIFIADTIMRDTNENIEQGIR